MKRIAWLLIALLLLLCGCSQADADNGIYVSSFSYEEVCLFYEAETVGIKRADFVNTEISVIENADQAVELAKKECTVEYDTFSVSYDQDAEIYCVSFGIEDLDGGNQDVYINQNGITELIVYGE